MFSGLSFAFCGACHAPHSTLRDTIVKHGGTVHAQLQADTSLVLASHAMSDQLDTQYKRQFVSADIQQKLQFVLLHSLVVIDSRWLLRCVAANHRVPYHTDKVSAICEMLEAQKNASRDQQESASALDARTQRVVLMLFDEHALNASLAAMDIDGKRLAKVAQLASAAFQCLSEIERALAAGDTSEAAVARRAALVRKLSEKYYSMIPHFTKTPISSLAILRERLGVLESLASISAGQNLKEPQALVADDAREQLCLAPHLASGGVDDALLRSTNRLDINYRKLGVTLTPLDRVTVEYDFIERYARNTFAESHRAMFRDVKIVQVFEVQRDAELQPFERQRARVGNVALLWHGSRCANFRGILSQGLRIAPPEAPVSGYFLGKAVYLADVFSKSAEYCHATPEQPEALMLLCEAALGNVYHTAHGKFIEPEMLDEAGYHSVLGMGRRQPDAAYAEHHGGVLVPLGAEGESPVAASELEHNEYTIYNTEQVRMKWLLHVKFEFDTEPKLK